MTGRVPRLLATVFVGAGMLAVPLVAAPAASACPIGMYSDPYTGRCFTQGALPTVSGIPCVPGQHLGTCLSILQNQPVPGGGPPPGLPWP